MSQKIKTIQTTTDKLSALADQLGVLLMTAATVTGMLELPNHVNNKIVLPNQPSFVVANDNEEMNNPIRREKEEAAPHYVSYSETQRTPSRSTKNR